MIIGFDRNWFSIDIEFCKPGVMQKCQVKAQTFQGMIYRIFAYVR